ncbi:hypothetical protein HPG69_018479 [Diceros bicornis minor]|uniref:Uncharacterized protein n=1 Tax=Diceros bicornis minor TaxID=77932 RepID=A0A7J7ER17_DICBM|nr:hypothetical protein HPG69_018479 [Diceros bicornis minor]
MMTTDYLSVKIWDLNMEIRPVETYQVHEYLRSKLGSLHENDCIFDKFEGCWNGSDSVVMTGSYNNFFRMFGRNAKLRQGKVEIILTDSNSHIGS